MLYCYIYVTVLCELVMFILNKKKDGTVIQSEARPTAVQLKRLAKLLILIGLTTKHAVCRKTSML